MKITFNWLKQYVDFTWSPEELAERLTMLGLEVEGIQKIGGEFEGIVVAQVITRDKHPNADKLSLCRVNEGKGERQIVCGAQNFKAGDKVPLILPGATLPAKPGEPPMTIKVGKIRGVESQGMLCSPQELGLPDQVDGLLILPETATVGQPFAEFLGRKSGNVIYDLEVTPNRPDWNSLIGIARDIAALTGMPLRMPDISIAPDKTRKESIAEHLKVRIDDPALCSRYTARLVRGVKVGPSPDWLRNILEAVGLRSICNIVDVTNYVMLETGQPLHAFDFHLLDSPSGPPTIVVRRALENEKFTTLDGKEQKLDASMLLIADESKGVALAGIMGGQNSEINSSTVDVLIESANFNPQNIRATSKKLDLRTDSSYRFERGADVGMTDWASQRAAELILQTAGGMLIEESIDAFPGKTDSKEILLRYKKTNELLGIVIPDPEQVGLLTRLGLESVSKTDCEATFRIPTFRVDLKREADLIEEIGRLFGIDRIPSTPPRGAIGSNPFDSIHDQIAEARRILAGLGLNETQSQTLISDKIAGLGPNPSSGVIALLNPLSSDMNVLRPSLLPGFLEILRQNGSRQNSDMAIFEIGHVFTSSEGKLKEQRKLSMILTGRRTEPSWTGTDRDATFDIFDLKGVLEVFFEHFGLRGFGWSKQPIPPALFLESAEITLGKTVLGQLGQISPAIAKRFDLRGAVLATELDFDLILARRNREKSFKPLPVHPSIRRDVAMLVGEAVRHEEIVGIVKQAKPANLERVDLFDVFRGKNIPPGQKSMAYAFIYRNAEHTLTDAEVNAAHDGVIQQFKQRLSATIRDT